MYYNRTLSSAFASLIEPKGPMRWLYDYVKISKELDFLIGKNNAHEWISIYRGLSRLITITPTNNSEMIRIDGADKYKHLANSHALNLYGQHAASYHFQSALDTLAKQVAADPVFNRYYNNMKEGYYQNHFSRRYGILSQPQDPMVIVDKEAVIGYKDKEEKSKVFGTLQNNYEELLKAVSHTNAARYGQDLNERSIGNELDFLALDSWGNVLLIEFKHGSNTSGIYLSPLQIGLYYDLFTQLGRQELNQAICDMLQQKQRIGLVHPNWKIPSINNCIIPVLIISEYNNKSSAKVKFNEILDLMRKPKHKGSFFLNKLQVYNLVGNVLKPW